MAIYEVQITETVELAASIEVPDGAKVDSSEVRERLIEVARDVGLESDRTVTSVRVMVLRPGSTIDAGLS